MKQRSSETHRPVLTPVSVAVSESADPKPPQRVAEFLSDAAARIDAFIELHRDNPPAGFVPSDYAKVYRSLAAMRQQAGGSVVPGNSFCEWGSGIGVVACLAAMLGFDCVGIEIDQRLVDASRKLASDYDLAVEFVQGSYVPNDHDIDAAYTEGHVMTLEKGLAAYEELGLDPDDFDCVFAYPWPGEDDVVTAIFKRYAAVGALLVTFHGVDGVLARRKVR